METWATSKTSLPFPSPLRKCEDKTVDRREKGARRAAADPWDRERKEGREGK